MQTQVEDKGISILTDGLGVTGKCIQLDKERSRLSSTLKRRGGSIWGLGSSMTRSERRNHRSRINDIDTMLARYHRVRDALEQGLEPFWPDDNWYVCKYWESRQCKKSKDIHFMFMNELYTPLPEEMLNEFEKAKGEAHFDAIAMAFPVDDELKAHDNMSPSSAATMIGFIVVEVGANLLFSTKTLDLAGKKQVVPKNRYHGVAIFKIGEWSKIDAPLEIAYF